jgi:ABC-2 type transport system permease protein
MFLTLVRVRARMAVNAAHAAPAWHKAIFAGFSLLILGLAAVIAAACAALVLLTQDGARGALTPATISLVGHIVEYLFLLLLAGSVPFVAATLFQAGDLPLLLAAPVPPRALVGAKLVDAAVANAGPSVALGVPALVGVGGALHLSLIGWLGLMLSLLLFLTLTPAATALLLLGSARAFGMRWVRAAVAFVSVALGLGVTLLAVAGAGSAARSGLLDPTRLEAGMRGDVAPSATLALASRDAAPAWLPSAWAAAVLDDTAKGRGLRAGGVVGLLGLTALTVLLVSGCLAVGPVVLASEAFLESDTGGPTRHRRGARPPMPGLSPPVAGVLWKDLKYVARDLVLLGQIGTALILYLVPFLLKIVQAGGNGPDNDLYGVSALVMLLVIVYMATSILSLTSVGLEGRGGWMVFASPVTRSAFLRAKWLGAGGLSFGIVLVLTLVAWPVFGLGAAEVRDALAVYLCACFALSGVGVGLAGLFPRFIYENPAHRASMWALTLGFAGATSYLIVIGLIAALAYLGITRGGLPVGGVLALAVGGFVLLSLLTGLVPVALAARRLRDYEWDL